MSSGFRIARIGGVEIRVNWSVGIIAMLIALSLADHILPDLSEGYSTGEYWLAGILTAVAFFAGLLAHELGHALVAQREGVEVRDITLWLFGGVAVLGSLPDNPRTSLRIAAAGPAVSFVLGAAGVAVGVAASGLVGSSLLWFGVMNFILVGFNLLPAFPLDGGRMYQAWRWHKTGDEMGSIEDAVRVGLIIGAGLVGLGVIEVLLGSLVGGVWLICIGWFLREAARAELHGRKVQGSLQQLPVRTVMTPAPATVHGDITIENFVAGMFFGGRHAAYPVVDDKGDLTGLITVNAIRALEGPDRMHRLVSEVATPIEEIVLVEVDSPVSELVEKMDRTGGGRALVLDDDLLVGIVAPSDIARLVTVVELAPTPPAHHPDIDVRDDVPEPTG